MSFTNPVALFWTALAVPIVIFYILKIRMRRVPVSTIMFWRQIYDDQQPRSLWQHLRHLLSLLLQLAFLLLLVFALTDPFFHWEIAAARKLVLVVDNSASMNATDVLPSRLEAAKAAGRQLLSTLRFRDQMAVVAAGTQPQVLCGMTGHERTLQEVLDSVPATDGPTKVAEAVALARRLIGDAPNGKVLLLSDGCFADAEKMAQAPDVQFVTIGGRPANVGITRFQTRRSLIAPIGYQILVEVVNHSDDAIDCRLSIDLEDEPVDVVPLSLKAGEQWSQVFEKTSTGGGTLVATLDAPDPLQADNIARALLPRRELQNVLLVTEPHLFLEKVFEANPQAALTIARDFSPGMPSAGVTVFHRQVPEQLPSGPVFVVDPTGSCDLWELGAKLENPIVTRQDKDSLLMTHVRLDNVLLPEAHRLRFLREARVLVEAVNGEPLYALIDRPEGKVVVLTVNLDQGDLPLRTAFPILATNALAFLSGQMGELREARATGDVLTVDVPAAMTTGQPASATTSAATSAEEAIALSGSDAVSGGSPAPARGVAVWSPSGNRRLLPIEKGKATLGPLDQCGLWMITNRNWLPKPAGEEAGQGIAAEGSDGASSATLQVACNLADRAESDLRTPAALLKDDSDSPLLAGFGFRPVWYYLIVLAWLLTAAEWFLYQRRWIT